MILWLILAATALVSVVGLVVTASNAEYVQALKTAKASHLNLSGGAATLLALGTVAVPAMWAWYAYEVGDWRFVAIFAMPLLVKVLYKVTKPKVKQ